jgi:hypothetical protein
MADRFEHPDFRRVVIALQGKRLECMLEAALSAFDLDLIDSGEEQEHWWWVQRVCSARLALGVRSSITAHWVRIWEVTSQGMVRPSMAVLICSCSSVEPAPIHPVLRPERDLTCDTNGR